MEVEVQGKVEVEVEVKLRPTVSRPVYRGVELPSVTHENIFFCIYNCGLLDVGRPLSREDGSVIYSYNCFWALPEQSLSGPSPVEPRAYFTISSETPSTWRARSQYLYPPETGWPSYTPGH
jgi:hypothetical protein